jgi:hypothetical protein
MRGSGVVGSPSLALPIVEAAVDLPAGDTNRHKNCPLQEWNAGWYLVDFVRGRPTNPARIPVGASADWYDNACKGILEKAGEPLTEGRCPTDRRKMSDPPTAEGRQTFSATSEIFANSARKQCRAKERH